MSLTVMRTITGCALVFFYNAAIADENWPMFSARPLIGYAQFADSYLLGDTADSTRIRTKKEDLVGGVAASFNYSYGDWRAEFEYAWRYRTDANGYVYRDNQAVGIRNNLQNQSATANLRRYFSSRSGRSPYVSLGMGTVRHHSEAEFVQIGDSKALDANRDVQLQPTWNIGAGIEFTTRSGWIIDLGYRYVDMGEAVSPRFSSGLAFATGKLSSHDIVIAIARPR